MPNRPYGWRKDPHNPEAVYHRPKAVRIPSFINLLQFCPPVRDQGQVGACTGFGIGGMAYVVAKLGTFAKEIYSPTWLYNGARDLEGTLAYDSGAMPEDVLLWAQLYGLLYEHYWPYDPAKLDKNPPGSTRMGQAVKYPNFQTIRVDNGVQGILSALADNHPVAIGAPWPAEWEMGSTNILPIPAASSQVSGGHETFLFGYDQSGRFVNDQNSWGSGWADGGRCKIPFEAFDWFKANGGYDAHYIIMDTIAPAPAPVPKKKFLCFG